ncbi:hypothetical protein FACS1894218_4190 [Bacilli bacterium]|nr:hypothetical protein FACS1894218_4190 [Bacilli bacterium]
MSTIHDVIPSLDLLLLKIQSERLAPVKFEPENKQWSKFELLAFMLHILHLMNHDFRAIKHCAFAPLKLERSTFAFSTKLPKAIRLGTL